MRAWSFGLTGSASAEPEAESDCDAGTVVTGVACAASAEAAMAFAPRRVRTIAIVCARLAGGVEGWRVGKGKGKGREKGRARGEGDNKKGDGGIYDVRAWRTKNGLDKARLLVVLERESERALWVHAAVCVIRHTQCTHSGGQIKWRGVLTRAVKFQYGIIKYRSLPTGV